MSNPQPEVEAYTEVAKEIGLEMATTMAEAKGFKWLMGNNPITGNYRFANRAYYLRYML